MVHFGFLSSYPPTRCGLATFTESLASALVEGNGVDARIVRVLDTHDPQPPTLLGAHMAIVGDLVAGDQETVASTQRDLNGCDIVIVQHEYGIYGGADGDEVLDVLRGLTVPTVVVLHTVLVSPTSHQRQVLREVCRLATVVVVMTANARDLLLVRYPIAAGKVAVIAHGVSTQLEATASSPGTRQGRRVLTWGLISPGKGIEWGIRAVAQLSDLEPPVEYVVAGQTHPKVLAQFGEQYRDMLTALAHQFELDDTVVFDSHYRNEAELAELVATADVVLLPYDSRDQATSGVLAEAVAAGVPVVATAFPHAVELLSGGAGLVVAHEDPTAMAAALRLALTAVDAAEGMREAALRVAPQTSWPAVAAEYRALSERLIATQVA